MKGLSAEDLNFNPPRFAVDRLRAFAGEYFGVSGTLEALDGERDQNHCLVTAEGKCFVLKVSAIGEDPAAVDFQVGALLHLAQFAPALPVPRVIASLRGNPVEWLEGEDGARHMVRLLSWLPGIPFSRGAALTPLAFRNIAAFQARLARGLRGYFHPHARHFVAWDIQRALILDPGLQAHVQPDALALCADFLRHAEREMLPRLKTLRAQVVHADGHTGNVLRENAAAEEVVGVIDFGDMVHAPVVQDIAVVIASFTRLADMSIANAVTQLEAYNAVLPLEDEEIELLHDAVLLRMVTALFMYDFRLGATHEPPGWLAEERPDIIVALRKFLALDRAEVTAAYRAACGRVTLRPIASSAELRARREKVMGPSYSLFYREPVHLVRGEGSMAVRCAGPALSRLLQQRGLGRPLSSACRGGAGAPGRDPQHPYPLSARGGGRVRRAPDRHDADRTQRLSAGMHRHGSQRPGDPDRAYRERPQWRDRLRRCLPRKLQRGCRDFDLHVPARGAAVVDRHDPGTGRVSGPGIAMAHHSSASGMPTASIPRSKACRREARAPRRSCATPSSIPTAPSCRRKDFLRAPRPGSARPAAC